MKHIPSSTYRFQFNHTFGFNDAFGLVNYIASLGISDLYASPIMKARKGSMHGYDAVSPDQLNPELGTPDDFENLSAECKRHNIHWLQDIVPNHMAYSFENKLLVDLLENGSSSQYYDFFDIEWNHPHKSVGQRLLAPFLGNYYQSIIEAGEIKLKYDAEGFSLNYYENCFPIKMDSYAEILSYRLNKLRNRLGKNHPDVIKYLGVLYVLRSLSAAESPDERYDQIKFAKAMLWELYTTNENIKVFIDESLKIYNGEKGMAESFNMLDQLHQQQFFRLSYWKVANEEINYRRFFNISDLISLKMENEDTFSRIHSYIFKLIKDEKFSGLRIDHIDGLYDPTRYLNSLRQRAQNSYIVVEKILELEEEIPRIWPVEGTTGYDFINFANGLFVDQSNEEKFSAIYENFSRQRTSYEDLVADKKRLIIEARMAGEVERLAFLIEAVSSKDRFGIDITMHGLKGALEEILTWFPVYRTYIDNENYSPRDRQYIEYVIERVKEKRPRLQNEFDYIGNLLLQTYSESFTDEQKQQSLDFIMKFQQLTGPLMAKGFEDTALYNYYRLISLNEVGGNPSRFGISCDEFHNYNRRKQELFPHAMNTSTTHDTKRGEDTRARINVISELPELWEEKVKLWSEKNARHKISLGRMTVPSANDEYMLYQALLGTYPSETKDRQQEKYSQYIGRIKDYIIKASREAKAYSSWVNPNTQYESGFQAFAEKILAASPGNEFLSDFVRFSEITSFFGIFNSISQALIKATAPGLPDYYQGSELWELSLVDPDNRRPVDYEIRKEFMKEMSKLSGQEDTASYINQIVNEPNDGRIKMYLIYRALKFRNENRELFESGEYLPLSVSGEYSSSIFAYARKLGEQYAVVVVPRLLTKLYKDASDISSLRLPLGEEMWKDTSVIMPAGIFRWTNVITQQPLANERLLPAGNILSTYPAALLHGQAS